MQTNAGAQSEFNRFAKAPGAELPRSVFDRSHGLKTAVNGGFLYPIMSEEMLPGDTMTVRENLFGRFTTLQVPVMHPIHVTTFYFAVPVRLLWENWDKFHGYRTGPSDTDVQSDFAVPEITVPVGGFDVGSIFDYMEIPPGVEHDRVNALFPRAYNLIYNEWFRDQDLVDEVTVNTGDGPDVDTDYTLLRRAKRKDYFTAARPWPSKGEEVSLPLGTSAPITGDITGAGAPTFDYSNRTGSTLRSQAGAINLNIGTLTSSTADSLSWNDPNLDASGLEADLSAATAATINQLREAFQIQRVYERDARSGNRHVEHLKAHWGVHPPDFRLMRPEFLSGKRTTVMVNPVATTYSGAGYSATDVPIGELSAYATAASSGNGWTYSAVEHMVVVGLACLHADVIYQQGLDRKHWRGADRFDYPLPALMHLGEQTIEAREIYADAADQSLAWGYQERWAEYRYAQSKVTGVMRSNVTNTLDVWQLALDFDTEPSLNQSFIEEDPPFDRVLAVVQGETLPAMKLDLWWDIKHARVMPTFSVPGMIDHF